MEPTKAILTIEGLQAEPINFVSLELDQCFYDHHRVKIILDLKQFGENVFTSPMQKTSLVNEKLQIDLQVGDDAANAYGFIGIITDMQIDLDAGDHGLLYVYAASPTIELERGKTLQTFSDTSLKQIFNEVTQSVRFLNLTNKPKYTQPIKYSMQYKETDFRYLQRLAWMYGEKFFFSGDSLVFGEMQEKETIKVTYDLELKEVRLGTRLISNTFQQYYYDINHVKSPYVHPLSEAGTFAGGASTQSDQLNLRKKPDLPMDVPTFNDGTLQYLTEMRKKRTFTNMFHVTGKTKLYKIRIGGLLEIDFHAKMKVDDSLGTLRIIRVRHIVDELGHYYNEFEAVPSKHGYIPHPEIDFPLAQSIPAVVVDNFDPDGLGKIQVQFDFEIKTCDYWFPIMTPEGGGNSNIGIEKNRGYIFIPEIKDNVLVSFFEGNPEFPFILGSMFHGRNAVKQGGGRGNHIKTITDKSQGQILMNTDEKGDWGITIHDRNGNIINLDTKEKNITITTPETMTLNAKNMNINVQEDMTINVQRNWLAQISGEKNENIGKDEKIYINQDFELEAKNTRIKTSRKSNIQVGEKLEQIAGEMTMHTNQGEIIIDGTGKITIQSKDRIDYGE